MKNNKKINIKKFKLLTSFLILSCVFLAAISVYTGYKLHNTQENRMKNLKDGLSEKSDKQGNDLTLDESNNEKENDNGADNKTAKDTKKISDYIKNMTLEQKVASLFIITPESLTDVENVVSAGDTTRAALQQYPVAGLIYFSTNIESEEQLKEMISTIQQYSKEFTNIPMFIGVDEEGGTVARVADSGAVDVPNVGNMSDIGATNNSANAYNAGMTIGSYLSNLGFNIDFAPSADLSTNPDNVVTMYRAFSSSSQLVSDMVSEELKGFHQNGIYGVIKHFPGHGSTSEDTHDGYAYTNKNLDEMRGTDMVPFVKQINEGVKFIMVGHISAPNIIGSGIPSSLSSVMINDILRKQFGYDGIVVTDALNMGAIQNSYTSEEASVMAIQAGVDLLLMPQDFKSAYNGIIEAVNDGRITEKRIDQSLERTLAIRFQL